MFSKKNCLAALLTLSMFSLVLGVGHVAEAVNPQEHLIQKTKNSSESCDLVVVKGEITEALPNRLFRVDIYDAAYNVLAHISVNVSLEEARRLQVGDEVLIEVIPCDLSKGRIVGRL